MFQVVRHLYLFASPAEQTSVPFHMHRPDIEYNIFVVNCEQVELCRNGLVPNIIQYTVLTPAQSKIIKIIFFDYISLIILFPQRFVSK